MSHIFWNIEDKEVRFLTKIFPHFKYGMLQVLFISIRLPFLGWEMQIKNPGG